MDKSDENKIDENKENNEIKNKEEETKEVSSQVVLVPKEQDEYEIDSLLKIVKNINTKFNIEDTKILSNFISQIENEQVDERYYKLKQIKEYISNIGMYKLMLKSQDDLENVKNDIKNIDQIIIRNFTSFNPRFDIQKFKDYLEVEIKKIDPTVYILVGDKELSYDALSPKIKTIYNRDICKGFKIVYKNKIYDYSL